MKAESKQDNRELRLIGLIKSISGSELIGDDAAVLESGILLSSDMLIEGQHFLLPQMQLSDIGWKSMAVNLSDIAAMAGIATYALVNIGLPQSFTDFEFESLYRAIYDCAACFGVKIAGGDLTGSEKLHISITVLGKSRSGRTLMRSGASAGDLIVASGDFGASAAALLQILSGQKADAGESYVMEKHLRPIPRLKEATVLLDLLETGTSAALMDTSDGLADALLQIAESSQVTLKVDAEKIPVHSQTRSIAASFNKEALDLALYGGEDYELLACISPASWERLSAVSKEFTQIGEVERGDAKALLQISGQPCQELKRELIYQHFAEINH